MCVWCKGDNYDPSREWDEDDMTYDLDNGDIPETDDEMYELLESGIFN